MRRGKIQTREKNKIDREKETREKKERDDKTHEIWKIKEEQKNTLGAKKNSGAENENWGKNVIDQLQKKPGGKK